MSQNDEGAKMERSALQRNGRRATQRREMAAITNSRNASDGTNY